MKGIDKNILRVVTYKFLIRDFYEKTDMNFFGCCIFGCVMYIMFIFAYIMSLIGKSVDWLFHIGRKELNNGSSKYN